MNTNLLGNLEFNLDGENAIPISPEHEIVITKVSNLIDQTLQNSDLLCNAECKKNKKEKQLFDDFTKYQENLLNAPEKFEKAERNFLIFKNGEDEYKRFMNEQYQEQLTEQINSLNNKYNSEYNKVKILVNSIENQKLSSQYVDELSNDYAQKLDNLQNKTNNEISNGELYNRETYYINEKISTWMLINKMFVFILWFLNIIYLILFIVYKQYTDILHIIGITLITIYSIFNYFYK